MKAAASSTDSVPSASMRRLGKIDEFWLTIGMASLI